MTVHRYMVKCQECGADVPFLDPNFCTSCGVKLSEEAKVAAPTMSDEELVEYRARQRSW